MNAAKQHERFMDVASSPRCLPENSYRVVKVEPSITETKYNSIDGDSRRLHVYSMTDSDKLASSLCDEFSKHGEPMERSEGGLSSGINVNTATMGIGTKESEIDIALLGYQENLSITKSDTCNDYTEAEQNMSGTCAADINEDFNALKEMENMRPLHENSDQGTVILKEQTSDDIERARRIIPLSSQTNQSKEDQLKSDSETKVCVESKSMREDTDMEQETNQKNHKSGLNESENDSGMKAKGKWKEIPIWISQGRKTKSPRVHCSTCNHAFLSKKTYDKHLDEGTCTRACKFCGKVFLTRTECQIHMKIHQRFLGLDHGIKMPVGISERSIRLQNSVFDIYCKECKHMFANKKNFDRHLRKDKCKQTCSFCGKIFLYGMKAHYLNHLKLHNKQKDYKCDICGKTFAMMNYLTRHIKRHEEPVTSVCDQCGLTFKCTFSLRNHISIKHNKNYRSKPLENRQKYQCPICLKMFVTPSRVSFHIRSIHDEDKTKKYSCSVCQKKFEFKSKLKEHEFVHTSARVHKCHQCSAAFKTQLSLKGHIKRHTGKYNYFCQFCGKGFYAPREVRDHENTHTGQKPYKCELCDYRCACKKNIGIHMKRVHRKRWLKSNFAL